MTFWHRAADTVKDKNSLLLAAVSFRRESELETAIIKATAHGSARFDYKHAHLVFSWVRSSPASLSPLLRCLTRRMRKTRSWPVALKGLIILHGVLHCGSPATAHIGNLRFQMARFTDKHSKPSDTWGFSAFIRAYYAFLEDRFCFTAEQSCETEESEMQRLKKLQRLLDLLLRVRPIAGNMKETLIIEAMDCVLVEIFEIYGEICRGVSTVMFNVDSSTKVEASIVLQILQNATRQGEELVEYFQFCKDFGVLNANVKDFPVVTGIPEEDIRELRRITNGGETEYVVDDKVIVVREENRGSDRETLKTVITTDWEVFEDDLVHFSDFVKNEENWQTSLISKDNYCLPPQKIPDLISF